MILIIFVTLKAFSNALTYLSSSCFLPHQPPKWGAIFNLKNSTETDITLYLDVIITT